MLGLLGARIIGAVTGNRAVDDAGIDGVDGFVVDAELLGDTRTEALDDDVGLLGHLQEPIDDFLILKVQRYRLLVAAECGDVVRDAATHSWVVVTHEVAETGILDLDDGCAEVCEDLGSVTAGKIAGKVKDGDI